jgi:hypothetical protein
MATQQQIEANQRNAARSSGPSPEGSARSRFNATRHGLAGQSVGVDAVSDEFTERRALWGSLYLPADPGAEFALDCAVAASLRIERCRRALDDLTALASERATFAWDEDQAIEAATIAGRLAKDPVLASRQLRASRAGVDLLIEFWVGLSCALEKNVDWSETERNQALDLLGVAPELRAHRTRIDPPDDQDHVIYHQSLVMNEVAYLKQLRDRAMVPLDEIERDQMIDGDVALVTKSAKLVMRYERDAWRQLRESLKVVQAKDREAEAPTLPASLLPPPLAFEPPPVAAQPPKPQVSEPARMTPVRRSPEPQRLDEVDPRIGLDLVNPRPTPTVAEFSAGRASLTERTQSSGRSARTGHKKRAIA